MENDFKNDLFYFCSMIEYIGRKTKSSLKDIIFNMSLDNIKKELESASVNHCLTFEQVSDEWIKKYNIKDGNFDYISTCEYDVPTYTSIGKVYQRLILDVSDKKNMLKTIKDVFSSFIVDAISNFNSSFYYSNPDYIRKCYENGKILD